MNENLLKTWCSGDHKLLQIISKWIDAITWMTKIVSNMQCKFPIKNNSSIMIWLYICNVDSSTMCIIEDVYLSIGWNCRALWYKEYKIYVNNLLIIIFLLTQWLVIMINEYHLSKIKQCFPIFYHCEDTGYLLNIMFIFNRCHLKSAVQLL